MGESIAVEEKARKSQGQQKEKWGPQIKKKAEARSALENPRSG
jgi:hypothetical protein